MPKGCQHERPQPTRQNKASLHPIFSLQLPKDLRYIKQLTNKCKFLNASCTRTNIFIACLIECLFDWRHQVKLANYSTTTGLTHSGGGYIFSSRFFFSQPMCEIVFLTPTIHKTCRSVVMAPDPRLDKLKLSNINYWWYVKPHQLINVFSIWLILLQ